MLVAARSVRHLSMTMISANVSTVSYLAPLAKMEIPTSVSRALTVTSSSSLEVSVCLSAPLVRREISKLLSVSAAARVASNVTLKTTRFA